MESLTVVRALPISVLVVVSTLISIIVATLISSHGLKNVGARERLLIIILSVALIALILVIVVEARCLLIVAAVLEGVLNLFNRRFRHFVVPLVILLAWRAGAAVVVLLTLLPAIAT